MISYQTVLSHPVYGPFISRAKESRIGVQAFIVAATVQDRLGAKRYFDSEAKAEPPHDWRARLISSLRVLSQKTVSDIIVFPDDADDLSVKARREGGWLAVTKKFSDLLSERCCPVTASISKPLRQGLLDFANDIFQTSNPREMFDPKVDSTVSLVRRDILYRFLTVAMVDDLSLLRQLLPFVKMLDFAVPIAAVAMPGFWEVRRVS